MPLEIDSMSSALEQVNILLEMGRWTGKHKDAIYGTAAGIPKDCLYGPTALS